MPSISLLPWRQALRQRRRKEFLYGIVGAFVLAGIVTLIASFTVSSMIDAQNRRNELLKAEIAELDKAIEQILVLEDQKARMIARIWVSNSAGFASDSRTPRRPSAGLGSSVNARPVRSALSAPMSSVRMVTVRPVMPSTTSR